MSSTTTNNNDFAAFIGASIQRHGSDNRDEDTTLAAGFPIPNVNLPDDDRHLTLPKSGNSASPHGFSSSAVTTDIGSVHRHTQSVTDIHPSPDLQEDTPAPRLSLDSEFALDFYSTESNYTPSDYQIVMAVFMSQDFDTKSEDLP